MKYKEFLAEQEKRTGFCPFENPKPEVIIAKNELAYLTPALAPYNPDHLLVIPMRHVKNIFDVTPEEHVAIRALEKEGWKLLQKAGHSGVSIVVREGKNTGGTVEHLHYHLIPDTRLGNMDRNGDERTILSQEEFAALAKKLRELDQNELQP